jgi:hypothetical protein
MVTGNTVRLKASFYSFADELADPSDVVINIYAHINKKLIQTGTPVKESTGVYYYDYTIPDDVDGDLVFEFIGTLEDMPTVARQRIEKGWLQ